MQFSHLFLMKGWLEPIAYGCHNTVIVGVALRLQPRAVESSVSAHAELVSSVNLLAVP